MSLSKLEALFNRNSRYDDTQVGEEPLYKEDLVDLFNSNPSEYLLYLYNNIGIKAEYIFNHTPNIRAAISESYSSIDMYLVIAFMDKLYRTDFSYGSYGEENFSPFYEVETVPKTIVEYVRVTD